MASVWNNTKKNHPNDLATRTHDLTLRLTLGKIQESKIPGNESLTFGKAS
jgi:hypothetical protein